MKGQQLQLPLCQKDTSSCIKRFFYRRLKFQFIERSKYRKIDTCLNVLAASMGKSPFVVYPEVIVESVKSKTALVISETSALVGLGFVSIDSSI